MSTVIQRNFSQGELSPQLQARADLVRYQTGLKQLINFVVRRWGGVSNRPGTKFVAEVKDSTKEQRLVRFVFNADQTYCLEFGNLYVRVIRNGVLLTETGLAITGVTKANPAVVTCVGHTFLAGEEVVINGVVGMTELNGRQFKVANPGVNTFELRYMDNTTPVNSTGFGTYSSGGTAARVYEIVTPYLEAELFDLRFSQTGDIITIAHRNHPPGELKRLGHTNWTYTAITFQPSIAAPSAGLSAVAGVAGPPNTTWRYKLTSIAQETFDESYGSSSFSCVGQPPTQQAPNTLSWTAVTGAREYNVYRETAPGSSAYGFIGVARTNQFADDNIPPNGNLAPPIARPTGFLTAANERPGVVSLFQQRRLFASSLLLPETAWASKISDLKNFSTSVPMRDDDAITFTVAGREVNEIRHMLDLGKLVIFTSAGEIVVEGDADGALSAIPAIRQQGFYGCSEVPPLTVGGRALFVQARGNTIRDLGYEFESDSYRGNELTVFATHLFLRDGIRDWAYQQVPGSIVWIVKDSGQVVGLTYFREHQVIGWHRHYFGSGVESVCSIPEGNEDSLYLIVRRDVPGLASLGGSARKYIERMYTREVSFDPWGIYSCFLDSALEFNGVNTDLGSGYTMTLSGGPPWTAFSNLTLTCSGSFFSASDVGNEMWILAVPENTILRCKIVSYTSPTVVTVQPHMTVQSSLQGSATRLWARAADQFGGLWHLEGEYIGAFGFGYVLANPLNGAYGLAQVVNGTVQFDRCVPLAFVGVAYASDLETLNIDSGSGETLIDKNKLVTAVTMFVESTRGLLAGPDVGNLVEYKLRSEEDYSLPVDVKTGTVQVNIPGRWNDNGRVYVRQVDPVPCTITAIAPAGLIPTGGDV